MQSANGGRYNSAFGERALTSVGTGESNSAFGYNAMESANGGQYNSAFGERALNNAGTGQYNSAFGYQALQNANGGRNNVAIGSNNLGNFTGKNIINGSNNTFLGSGAIASGDYSNSTAIGFNATVQGSSQIAIGTASERTVIGGGAAATGYILTVTGSIQAVSYNATSDRRLKSNIQFLSNQSKSILNVVPVTFDWKVDGRHDIGFIAQNIYETYPELRPKTGIDPSSNIEEPTDACGNPIYYAIDYGRMTPFLWQGMREIIQRLDALESENRNLKSRIEVLESK